MSSSVCSYVRNNQLLGSMLDNCYVFINISDKTKSTIWELFFLVSQDWAQSHLVHRWSLSDFSYCSYLINCWWKSHLKKESLGSQFKDTQPILVGTVWCWVWDSSDIVQSGTTERGMRCSACSLLSKQPRTQAHGTALPMFRVGYLFSAQTFWK